MAVLRSGWDWVVEGDADLVGPDDAVAEMGPSTTVHEMGTLLSQCPLVVTF